MSKININYETFMPVKISGLSEEKEPNLNCVIVTFKFGSRQDADEFYDKIDKLRIDLECK